MFLAVFFIVVGFLFFYISIKDEGKREKNLTVGYVMHLGGYVGGIGLFLAGLFILLNKVI